MISFQNNKSTGNYGNRENRPFLAGEITDEQLAILKACTVFLEEKERHRLLCMLHFFEFRKSYLKLQDYKNNGNNRLSGPQKEPNMDNFMEILKKELPPGKNDFIRQYEEMMETMAFYQELMLMKRE